MTAIIILGSGLAGYTVAREFRKLNRDVPLTIVSRDCGSFYSKPMLSNAFQLGKEAGDLANFTAQQMATQLDAKVIAQAEVEAIDVAGRCIVVAGQRLPYRALVLALGGDQRAIDLQGAGAADVLTVNDLADYARFRQALAGCRRVAILGAGLIGCEFANDLALANYQVALVDPASWPLSRVLPEAPGRAMASALTAAGVALHLGAAPLSIERRGGYRLHLSNGTVLDADRVVAAIGLAPRLELARRAGLQVERGIVADACLRTSAPDVYALGDCAQVDGRVLPYVMPLMHAARALAKTLHGELTPVVYPVMPVVVKTPALPTVLVAAPQESNGRWESGDCAAGGAWRYRDEEQRTRGFALMGDAVKEKNAWLKSMAPS